MFITYDTRNLIFRPAKGKGEQFLFSHHLKPGVGNTSSLQILFPTVGVQHMVHFSLEQHMSTGQMSPLSISSLYHTEAISVNYTAHNASHWGQLLNDTLPIMDGPVKKK